MLSGLIYQSGGEADKIYVLVCGTEIRMNVLVFNIVNDNKEPV